MFVFVLLCFIVVLLLLLFCCLFVCLFSVVVFLFVFFCFVFFFGGGGGVVWGEGRSVEVGFNSLHNQNIPVTSRVSHEGVSPVPNTSPRVNSCVSLNFRRGRAVCFLILTSLQTA